MGALDLEFRTEDAVISFLNTQSLGMTLYPGLSLADFATNQANGEGFFVSCDELEAVELEQGNSKAKVVVGVFSFRVKKGVAPATQLTSHRQRTDTIRQAILRDDLAVQLNGRISDFTAIGWAWNGAKTYRTSNHIVSVVDLTIFCCGSTIG